MSAPEALINSLYRSGNLTTKDIQSIISSIQAEPKQIDEDVDIELNMLDDETRNRIETHVVNPGGGFQTYARNRSGENSYIREIPTTVNIYPLTHVENGTGSFILSDKKFSGGFQTDGTYYQSIVDKTRLNPTETLGVIGWLKIPSGITSGKILNKSTQYNIEITSANTLSFNVNSKTPVELVFSDDTWFHFACTYKSTLSGQKIYKNSVLVDSDSDTGNIISTSNSLGILANSNGTSKLGNNCVIAHLTMLNGEPDNTWITNHYNGILDTNIHAEIMTIPFVAHGRPLPDASVGRCQIN